MHHLGPKLRENDKENNMHKIIQYLLFLFVLHVHSVIFLIQY